MCVFSLPRKPQAAHLPDFDRKPHSLSCPYKRGEKVQTEQPPLPQELTVDEFDNRTHTKGYFLKDYFPEDF